MLADVARPADQRGLRARAVFLAGLEGLAGVALRAVWPVAEFAAFTQ